MFQASKKELAEQLGLTYLDVQGLVKFLVKIGVARKVGEKRNGQKGKSTEIFEFPSQCTIVLKEVADQLSA